MSSVVNETQQHLEFIIPSAWQNQRIDQVLPQLLPAYSRSLLSKWLKTGLITVADKFAKPSMKVVGNERIKFATWRIQQDSASLELIATNLALDVIYADSDILVINKPKNLVVHPASGHVDDTLVNALIYHFPELRQMPRAGIIHRLDKDTTGLLLVAKNPATHLQLVNDLAARNITRQYFALVRGTLISGGTIDAPIGRHPHDRLKMAINLRGKPAITHYRIAQRYPGVTAVDVYLATGRTHQIRVHFAHLGYPILGDKLYNTKQLPSLCSLPLQQALLNLNRQALHAVHLEFIHPHTNKSLALTAPLPADIQHVLACI